VFSRNYQRTRYENWIKNLRFKRNLFIFCCSNFPMWYNLESSKSWERKLLKSVSGRPKFRRCSLLLSRELGACSFQENARLQPTKKLMTILQTSQQQHPGAQYWINNNLLGSLMCKAACFVLFDPASPPYSGQNFRVQLSSGPIPTCQLGQRRLSQSLHITTAMEGSHLR